MTVTARNGDQLVIVDGAVVGKVERVDVPVVLDRFKLTAGGLDMRHAQLSFEEAIRRNPTLQVWYERFGRTVTILGRLKFILPIKGSGL